MSNALPLHSVPHIVPGRPQPLPRGGLGQRRQERPGRSRLEAMARLSHGLSTHLGAVLDVVLAACPDQGRGLPVLRPLWGEEAMHRAYGLMRLVGARNRRDGGREPDPISAEVERILARDLAALFGALQGGQEAEAVPCSRILRDTVAGLDALFGSVAGEIAVSTDIEPMVLPAYRRRALVLAAVELVTNALLHAFRGRSRGRIVVGLKRVGPDHAGLIVMDDGTGFTGRVPDPSRSGVAGGLADLLEAELAYSRSAGWTIAAILFPTTDGRTGPRPELR